VAEVKTGPPQVRVGEVVAVETLAVQPLVPKEMLAVIAICMARET
jgi:hypothetical protein